jgi:acetolactate synthase-1/2/3 large subunit
MSTQDLRISSRGGAATPSTDPRASALQVTAAGALVDGLVGCGVSLAFGVSGGGVAGMWAALSAHRGLQVVHCQHEGGAAFAATEAYFAGGAPVVVFTTTGPGLTNAITGLVAARTEGAKVIVVSGVTPAGRRLKGATQETHAGAPLVGLFSAGALFDDAFIVESPQMLPAVLQRLSAGLSRPGGYVAHIGMPSDVQSAPALVTKPAQRVTWATRSASDGELAKVAQRLGEDDFVIWVGFEARGASEALMELVRRTGAKVMCSPRAKGIFPEDHPDFLGVTGFAGHDGPARYMQGRAIQHVLVLGSRLGEGASQWSEGLKPRSSLIQVDPTGEGVGGPFPDVEVFALCADIPTFVADLADFWPAPEDDLTELPSVVNNITPFTSRPSSGSLLAPGAALAARRVRPSALMRAIQQVVIDNSDALVMAESGNAFAWAIHSLSFRTPRRWRVSVEWGSMGHFAAGVVGAAIATGQPTVAIVGDGSMLMNHELATAVYHRLPAIWVVLNDSCYNMCRQGMSMLNLTGVDANTAPIHFANLARSMGALGLRVDNEHQLNAALSTALVNPGPTVLDVSIDADEMAPISRRIQSLTWNE